MSALSETDRNPFAGLDTPARIVLVRHGQTEWSVTGQHTGVTDIPLTAEGEEEARQLGAVFGRHPFGLVLASPRQRAQRTAVLAGYPDFEVEPDLAEYDYGAYEGLTSSQIVERHGGEWNLWFDGVPAGATPGETPEQVRARVLRVMGRACDTLRQGKDVLLVAHGHILRAFGAAWIGLPPSGGSALVLGTASLSVLGFEHADPVIRRWNASSSAPSFGD